MFVYHPYYYDTVHYRFFSQGVSWKHAGKQVYWHNILRVFLHPWFYSLSLRTTSPTIWRVHFDRFYKQLIIKEIKTSLNLIAQTFSLFLSQIPVNSFDLRGLFIFFSQIKTRHSNATGVDPLSKQKALYVFDTVYI